MSLRFFRELILFGCAASGAIIGYCAGAAYEPAIQLVLAFLGMSLAGALTDLCLTRS